MDVLVSTPGSEISNSRGDFAVSAHFSTRSTLTKMPASPRVCLFVKCPEVQNSPPRTQKQVHPIVRPLSTAAIFLNNLSGSSFSYNL